MTYDISYVVTHCMPATRKVAGMQLNGMKTTFPVFRFIYSQPSIEKPPKPFGILTVWIIIKRNKLSYFHHVVEH